MKQVDFKMQMRTIKIVIIIVSKPVYLFIKLTKEKSFSRRVNVKLLLFLSCRN